MRPPDYKMVQGGNVRVNMDPGAASATGRAFAKMGSDLAEVGIEAAGLFQKAEQAHNAGAMADFQLELDAMYSDYAQKMSENPNNALKWREDFDRVLKSKSAEIEKRDISRGLRNQMDQYFKVFSGQKALKVSETAHQTILTNASRSIETRVNDLRQRGDRAGATQLVSESVERGLMASARGEELGLEMEREQIQQDLNDRMEEDPKQYIEDARAGKIKGVTDAYIQTSITKAKSLLNVQRMDDIDDVKNLIDGSQIMDEQELMKVLRSREMDATSSRAMISYYSNRSDEELARFYAQPEQQNAAYANAEYLLSNYKPNGEPEDLQYAGIVTALQYVPDTPRKKEFLKKLDAVRSGAELKVKNTQDFARKESARIGNEAIAQLEARKPKVIERTRDEFINDRFFTPTNLAVYFNENEIDDILEATEKIGTKKVVTIDAQAQMFKKLWNKRKSQGQTKWQREMGFSLAFGSGKDVLGRYEDQKAGEAWDAERNALAVQLGEQSSQLEDYLLSNPKAQHGDVMKRLIGIDIHAQSTQPWGTVRPGGGEVKAMTPEESKFRAAYAKYAEENSLDPDPDHPAHFYDYRGAWEAGLLSPDADGHLPSKFKMEGHPRMYQSPDGERFSSKPRRGWRDTREPEALDTELVDMVKEFESFNAEAYGDYKQTSIGYGTVAKPGEKKITKAEAERRLKSELKMHHDKVMNHARAKGYDFNKNQIKALTSFSYNIGSINQLTAGGTRTIAQIGEKMLEYNKAGGKKLSGLEKRRRREAELFNRNS